MVIVFLPLPGLQATIYRTRAESTIHYTNETVRNKNRIPYIASLWFICETQKPWYKSSCVFFTGNFLEVEKISLSIHDGASLVEYIRYHLYYYISLKTIRLKHGMIDLLIDYRTT